MADPVRQIRPLMRLEYDKLVALGAFEGERIELLDGELVYVSPMGVSHSSAAQLLNELLIVGLRGRASVRPQLPFAALAASEPEPDLAIVPRGPYDAAHPDQALLINEIADSSLSQDRGPKARIYATSTQRARRARRFPDLIISVAALMPPITASETR